MSILSENWCTQISRMLILNSDLDFWNSDPKPILPENYYTKYLKDADSEPRLRCLKFWPQNQFLGKFGPKKSKVSVLSENWYTWYLESADSESGLSFWNSDLKIYFWANLGRKIQSCPFFLKIGMHGILTMLIFIPILVFWISDPKSIFGQMWTKKVKVVCFTWKLVHMLSRGFWFLFQY